MTREKKAGRRGSRVSTKTCKNCGHAKSLHVKKKFNCKLCFDCVIFKK